MAQPPATADLNAFLADGRFTPVLQRGLPPGGQIPQQLAPLQLNNIQFAPPAPNEIGGGDYFGSPSTPNPLAVPWNPQANIQNYAGMENDNDAKLELIAQGERILWANPPPGPSDNAQGRQVARAVAIRTLGFDVTVPAQADRYDGIMIKAAIGKAKVNIRNRIYRLANNIGWRNVDESARLIGQLDNISVQIATALDSAPGGQAQANLAPLQDMLERLVTDMAGGNINAALTSADELVQHVEQQQQLGNISDMLSKTLVAEILRLEGMLAARQHNPAQPAVAVPLVGGRRKSKKTRRKSKTRKAGKTGKKRKGGYKFTRAANSRRSLRMKTRKLKSLTQKTPKKKHAKKHAKKHGKKHNKKHGKKSKYHRARSGKHKRGKRR